MKKLRIDLADLAVVFEDASGEQEGYLDLETGRVVWISSETRSELERIYEQAGDAESGEEADLAALLQDSDLPDWQKEALLEADQVKEGHSSRYIAVPQADSREDYRDMEEFISTVPDERLRNDLWRAIQGGGAFRRFKDMLAGHRREQERWYAFQEERLRQHMLDWLESEGIEPILPGAPAER